MTYRGKNARLIAIALLIAAVMALGARPASGQFSGPRLGSTEVKRSGPRFGVTFLGGGIVDTLRERYDTDVGTIVTQFGWQFERQFMSFSGGPTAVSEWIVLVGGLEQGVFLPSLSWIVGVRLPNDIEFGVGPNLTPAGAALVLTGGKTFRAGALNVPVNLAVVPSKVGTRVSLLTGFNTHR